MKHCSLFIFILFGWLNLASAGELEEYCQENKEACATVGEWQLGVALGLGIRTNPLVNSDDIPIFAIPKITYYGERLFFENWELGYTLLETPKQMVNLLVIPSFDQLYFEGSSLKNLVIDGSRNGGFEGIDVSANTFTSGADSDVTSPDRETPNIEIEDLDPRRMAALGGIEYLVDIGSMGYSLQILQDVIGVHNGQEIRFAIDKGIKTQSGTYTFTTGFHWQSQKLIDYYYGLDSHESSEIYRAGGGFSPFARIEWTWKLNKRWRLLGSLQYKHQSPEITDSPIVEDKSAITAFFGGLYHF